MGAAYVSAAPGSLGADGVADARSLQQRARWQAGVASHAYVATDGDEASGVSSTDPSLFHLGADGKVAGRIALPHPGIHAAVALDHAVWVVADGGPVMRVSPAR